MSWMRTLDGVAPSPPGRPDIGGRQAGHSIMIPDKWPEPEGSVWTIKCGTSFLLETSRHPGWTLTHVSTSSPPPYWLSVTFSWAFSSPLFPPFFFFYNELP